MLNGRAKVPEAGAADRREDGGLGAIFLGYAQESFTDKAGTPATRLRLGNETESEWVRFAVLGSRSR